MLVGKSRSGSQGRKKWKERHRAGLRSLPVCQKGLRSADRQTGSRTQGERCRGFAVDGDLPSEPCLRMHVNSCNPPRHRTRIQESSDINGRPPGGVRRNSRGSLQQRDCRFRLIISPDTRVLRSSPRDTPSEEPSTAGPITEVIPDLRQGDATPTRLRTHLRCAAARNYF